MVLLGQEKGKKKLVKCEHKKRGDTGRKAKTAAQKQSLTKGAWAYRNTAKTSLGVASCSLPRTTPSQAPCPVFFRSTLPASFSLLKLISFCFALFLSAHFSPLFFFRNCSRTLSLGHHAVE